MAIAIATARKWLVVITLWVPGLSISGLPLHQRIYLRDNLIKFMFDNSNDPGRHPSSPVADNKVNNNGERNPPAKNVDIYVMPSKFLPNKRPATKAGRGAKIIIFALTFTLILGAGVAGGVWDLNKSLAARPAAND